MWKETLWLNFLRAVCVLPVLIGFSIMSGGMASASFYISYPFIYIILVAPLLVLIRAFAIAIGGGLAWFIIIPMALIFIAGGDPIVFAISKIKPELIPLNKYPFICLDVALFVLKN
jgi:hypothetical protein